MGKKKDEDNPEVWEDWNDDWADEFLNSSEHFGDDNYDDPSNIASMGGDYYKMFIPGEKLRNY